MRLDLFEFEAVPEGGGEGAAAAAPDPIAVAEPVADPAAEAPAVEPAGEPEAEWVGPSREEWQQTQDQLREASELAAYLRNQPAPVAEPEALPEYDPFDPESAQRYFEARDARLLSSLQETLRPIVQRTNLESALEWQQNTFGKLGVPEESHWQEGVLFASTAFTQDAHGNDVPHEIAAQRGYEFLKGFSQAERQAGVEEYKKTLEAEQAALRERANSPVIPSGPAGGEGVPEGMDELAAARRWRERDAAEAV